MKQAHITQNIAKTTQSKTQNMIIQQKNKQQRQQKTNYIIKAHETNTQDTKEIAKTTRSNTQNMIIQTKTNKYDNNTIKNTKHK